MKGVKGVAAALGLAWLAACDRSEEFHMNAFVASVPPIDRDVPAVLETATFALG